MPIRIVFEFPDPAGNDIMRVLPDGRVELLNEIRRNLGIVIEKKHMAEAFLHGLTDPEVTSGGKASIAGRGDDTALSPQSGAPQLQINQQSRVLGIIHHQTLDFRAILSKQGMKTVKRILIVTVIHKYHCDQQK